MRRRGIRRSGIPKHFWSRDETSLLTRLWSEGMSSPDIAAELTRQSQVGWIYTRQSITHRARKIGLPARYIDWYSRENKELIRLCQEGKSDRFICEVLGLDKGAMRYRADKLISYDLLQPRRTRQKKTADEQQVVDAGAGTKPT